MLSRSISDLTILTLIIQLQQKQSTLLASTCCTMPFSACALKKKCFLWSWYCGKKEIAACINMSTIPFSACALKKNFLWHWYCGKKGIEMCFNVVCTLIDNSYVLSLFCQTFFCSYHILSKFAKVFERKVWCIMQHMQKF